MQHVLEEDAEASSKPAPKKMPRMPAKQSQKMRAIAQKIVNSQSLSPQQIANIEEALSSGQCELPKLPPGCVWALVDSGSAPHAAPRAKLFSGAQLCTDPSDRKEFAAANGSLIQNNGKFLVNFSTQEGHARSLWFRDSNVSFPIISTGLIADHGNDSWFSKHGGAHH